MQEARMHLTDWYDDCRGLAALVPRLGICLLGAGIVGTEPVAAQDDGVAELCRNGVVVPEPQEHTGLVADCEVLWGLRDQWEDSDLNWSAERPIRQWEGISLSEVAIATVLGSWRNSSELRVTYLRLSNPYNLDVLPPEIGQLSKLERLEFSRNKLKTIPPEIGQLIQLKSLALQDNNLDVLPPEIGQLKKLEALYLSGNDLEVLPSETGQLAKLEDLVLSANEFETIPSELSQLGNLRTLHIGSCRLRGAILPDLGNLDQLERLDLGDNFLSGAIPPELGQLALLDVLNLSENELTGQIPPDLGRMAALEKLDLSGNDLSGSIPPELGQLRRLGSLDLSHNRLSGTIPPELAQLGRLDSLDLSHNRLSGPLGRGLVELFRQNPVHVDFSGNEVCVPDLPIPLGDIPVCNAPPPPEPSEGRIYWTAPPSGEIQRANLDGSNVEVVIDGGGSPEGIALDPAAGKLYWTEWRSYWPKWRVQWTPPGKIKRSDLDGSNLETLAITGEHPREIALDLDADKVYYTVSSRERAVESGVTVDVYFCGGVRRANLDGSSPEDLVSKELPGLEVDIALNVSAGTMFWTDGGTIRRANLDGTGDICSPCLHIDTVEDMNTVDIVLDVPGGMIYWSDSQGIHRADLDGSNKETLLTFDGQPVPRSLALDLKGGRMYWTDSQAVYRADLDGSNAEPLFIGAEHPGEIAFDPVSNKLYWTEPEAKRIQRVDLDGTHVETVVSRPLRAPSGLALDMAGNRMYWTDLATNRIHRADLDGTHIEDLAGGLTAPGGIALDVPGGKMYWTNRDTSVIHRADLDGGNVENLVIPTDPERGEPRHPDRSGWNGMVGIALDLAAGRMYWMDWRFELNGTDMTYRIGRAWLAGTHAEVVFQHSLYTAGYPWPGIGVGGIALDPVGGKMYSVLRSSLGVDWDSDWVPTIPGILHRSNLNGSDIEDLGISLEKSDAIAVDAVEGGLYWSPGYSIHWTDLQGNKKTLLTGLDRVGSIALDFSQPETLVSTFFPESNLPVLSGLAPNYPNPFNAGTRLVYRLADPGSVRLEIFNVLGQRVRTLVDETQKAGSYQTYWDARDQGGAPAAAGVYVTRLQHPGGEQTRRLLLLK